MADSKSSVEVRHHEPVQRLLGNNWKAVKAHIITWLVYQHERGVKAVVCGVLHSSWVDQVNRWVSRRRRQDRMVCGGESHVTVMRLIRNKHLAWTRTHNRFIRNCTNMGTAESWTVDYIGGRRRDRRRRSSWKTRGLGHSSGGKSLFTTRITHCNQKYIRDHTELPSCIG